MLMYTNEHYLLYYQRIIKTIFYVLGSMQCNTQEMTILDCGCGNGLILREMLHLGFKPENCQGFDANPLQIELGKPLTPPTMNITVGQLPRADWCGDFERDITMCIGVFMFIKDTDKIVESLANIRKMTKKGGLLLTVNTHLCHQNIHDQTLRNFDYASNELANLAAPYFSQEILTPICRSSNIYGPAKTLVSLEEFEQEALDVQLMKVPVTHFMSVMRAI